MRKLVKSLINRINYYKYQRAISSDSVEDRFTNIYKKNLWFGNKQSKSGSGSTLEATHSLRYFLPKFLKKVAGKNLTDLGCGDFYWMKEVNLPCKYIGLDVVAPIIEENNQKYSDDSHYFYHHNAVEDPLPKASDIILCREVLFHLSFKDGLKLIKNVLRSEARYLLITTSEDIEENLDIRTGQFRNINLKLPPYSFPPYLSREFDSAISKDRILGIWEISQLREVVGY